MARAMIAFCTICPSFYQDRDFRVMGYWMRSANPMHVSSFFLTAFAVKTVPT